MLVSKASYTSLNQKKKPTLPPNPLEKYSLNNNKSAGLQNVSLEKMLYVQNSLSPNVHKKGAQTKIRPVSSIDRNHPSEHSIYHNPRKGQDPSQDYYEKVKIPVTPEKNPSKKKNFFRSLSFIKPFSKKPSKDLAAAATSNPNLLARKCTSASVLTANYNNDKLERNHSLPQPLALTSLGKVNHSRKNFGMSSKKSEPAIECNNSAPTPLRNVSCSKKYDSVASNNSRSVLKRNKSADGSTSSCQLQSKVKLRDCKSSTGSSASNSSSHSSSSFDNNENRNQHQKRKNPQYVSLNPGVSNRLQSFPCSKSPTPQMFQHQLLERKEQYTSLKSCKLSKGPPLNHLPPPPPPPIVPGPSSQAYSNELLQARLQSCKQQQHRSQLQQSNTLISCSEQKTHEYFLPAEIDAHKKIVNTEYGSFLADGGDDYYLPVEGSGDSTTKGQVIYDLPHRDVNKNYDWPQGTRYPDNHQIDKNLDYDWPEDNKNIDYDLPQNNDGLVLRKAPSMPSTFEPLSFNAVFKANSSQTRSPSSKASPSLLSSSNRQTQRRHFR